MRNQSNLKIVIITQSKAFSKSQNIPPTNDLLLNACRMSFNSLNVAFCVEELLLKPYCSIDNILLLITCSVSLACITFSNILEKEVNRDIGL